MKKNLLYQFLIKNENMIISDAFILAGKIGFHYNRRSIHSLAINTEIAQALGITLYERFCEEIALLGDKTKSFSVNFLKSPVDEKDCINDMEVYTNYRLDSLMSVLSKITS